MNKKQLTNQLHISFWYLVDRGHLLLGESNL